MFSLLPYNTFYDIDKFYFDIKNYDIIDEGIITDNKTKSNRGVYLNKILFKDINKKRVLKHKKLGLYCLINDLFDQNSSIVFLERNEKGEFYVLDEGMYYIRNKQFSDGSEEICLYYLEEKDDNNINETEIKISNDGTIRKSRYKVRCDLLSDFNQKNSEYKIFVTKTEHCLFGPACVISHLSNKKHYDLLFKVDGINITDKTKEWITKNNIELNDDFDFKNSDDILFFVFNSCEYKNMSDNTQEFTIMLN